MIAYFIFFQSMLKDVSYFYLWNTGLETGMVTMTMVTPPPPTPKIIWKFFDKLVLLRIQSLNFPVVFSSKYI